MLAVIATMRVKPNTEKEFEAVAKELAAKVNANEPGCKLYTLCKGEAPRSYVFLERYADEAAVNHHRSTEYFKELGRKLGYYIDGRPDIQRLTEL